MNNLAELKLKTTYDPSFDGTNLLNDFYIPCLKNSVRYDRCSAYFSSAILRKFSSGLETFCLKNKGKIRFIFSDAIDETEMNNIRTAYKSKMDKLASDIKAENIDTYELANLSYLISIGVAEVKIAFMIKQKSALMHIKSGLFCDDKGNKIYFEGSGNETESGIMHNAEIFHVFNNFSMNPEYVDAGEKRFENMWNNTYAPDTIYTEKPVGELFDVLMSFNKNRFFQSQKEYVDFIQSSELKRAVIDVDQRKGIIKIFDFTEDKTILTTPMVLKTNFDDNDWKPISSIQINIQKLNLYTLKSVIIPSLTQFEIPFVLSENALDYINKYELQIEKRLKLGEIIKSGFMDQYPSLKEEYLAFQKIVDEETELKLKPYQMVNAFYHYCMKTSCDFSVPGSGKTFISYGLFAFLSSKLNESKNKCDKMVIFGPLNSFKAWTTELKNIFGSKKTFAIFDSRIGKNKKQISKISQIRKYDIYLFNYETINTEEKIFELSKLIDSNTFVVFDEIHKIKNPSGLRASCLMKMLESCASAPIFKLALTGTPAPNSYIDLFNYIYILYPNEKETYFADFNINYLRSADLSALASQKINEIMSPFFVRTTKQELSIPPAEPDDMTTLSCVADNIQQQLFDAIKKAYIGNFLVLYLRLLQASSNPNLLLQKISREDIDNLYNEDDDEIKFQLFGNDDSQLNPKCVEEIKGICEQIELTEKTAKTIEFIKQKAVNKQKVVVWCLFINTIDLLKNELKKRGIKSIDICGRTPAIARDELIDKFLNSDINVLITNPNTLAESISLHKQCHDAVYLEYGLNFAYMSQSKDRIHRIGLSPDQKTNYYFALTDESRGNHSSIDWEIYHRLEVKNKRMEALLSSSNIKTPDVISDERVEIEKIVKNLLS